MSYQVSNCFFVLVKLANVSQWNWKQFHRVKAIRFCVYFSKIDSCKVNSEIAMLVYSCTIYNMWEPLYVSYQFQIHFANCVLNPKFAKKPYYFLAYYMRHNFLRSALKVHLDTVGICIELFIYLLYVEMGKFMKGGKVVLVLGGRFAGRKGVIVKVGVITIPFVCFIW